MTQDEHESERVKAARVMWLAQKCEILEREMFRIAIGEISEGKKIVGSAHLMDIARKALARVEQQE